MAYEIASSYVVREADWIDIVALSSAFSLVGEGGTNEGESLLVFRLTIGAEYGLSSIGILSAFRFP